MKVSSVFLICLSIQLSVQAQIIPETNSHDEYRQHNVRLLRTVYEPGGNSIIDDKQIIFEKEFDKDGKLVRMYQLFLWEAVSYSYTTTYDYSDESQLIEEERIQNILNLTERDEDYVRIFGNKPLNQRYFYYYDEAGQLSRKDIFNYGDEFSDSAFSQSVIYQYENSQKIKEQSSSPDEKVFNRNYQIMYQYDSAGNLINKTRAFGEDLALRRATTYMYNNERELLEERTIDDAFPHNNSHFKYTYNAKGKLHKKFVFEAELEDFELLTTYEYDAQGRAIRGDRNVQFEYDEKGLIISESWTEPISEETITLKTSFEYF